MSGQTTTDARAADRPVDAPDSFERVVYERDVGQPAFVADLNLDRLVVQSTSTCEGYDLAEFLYAVVHDPGAVGDRHEVVRDLGSVEISAAVKHTTITDIDTDTNASAVIAEHDGIDVEKPTVAVEQVGAAVPNIDGSVIGDHVLPSTPRAR